MDSSDILTFAYMEAQIAMDRRCGARIRTDFHLTAYRDGYAVDCRAVDLSATGALVRRRSGRQIPMVQRVELHLGRAEPLRAMARTAWSRDDLQALHFIGLNDVDRLDIAQHLDDLELERRYGSPEASPPQDAVPAAPSTLPGLGPQ